MRLLLSPIQPILSTTFYFQNSDFFSLLNPLRWRKSADYVEHPSQCQMKPVERSSTLTTSPEKNNHDCLPLIYFLISRVYWKYSIIAIISVLGEAKKINTGIVKNTFMTVLPIAGDLTMEPTTGFRKSMHVSDFHINRRFFLSRRL